VYFGTDTLDQRRSDDLLASTVAPRPIAWVFSCDTDGQPNAAPCSFFELRTPAVDGWERTARGAAFDRGSGAGGG
jgi:hypothetical protein